MDFEFDRFIPYFRMVGYGLFGLLLLDYAAILIPARLTNPLWEFETIGRLVELIWAPLLGGILVFFPKANPQEFNFRFWLMGRLISWFLLILAILHLLMAPLLVVDTVRIYRGNTTQLSSQLLQLDNQLKQQTQELERLSTTELNRLLRQLQEQAPEGEQLPVGTGVELRSQLLETVQTDNATAKQQVQAEFLNGRNDLIKRATKWFLGTLVSCALLFNVWQLSRESQRAWIQLLELLRDL